MRVQVLCASFGERCCTQPARDHFACFPCFVWLRAKFPKPRLGDGIFGDRPEPALVLVFLGPMESDVTLGSLLFLYSILSLALLVHFPLLSSHRKHKGIAAQSAAHNLTGSAAGHLPRAAVFHRGNPSCKKYMVVGQY